METDLKKVTKEELLGLIDKWTDVHKDIGLICLTVENCSDDNIDVETISAGKPIDLVQALCRLLLDKVEDDEHMGFKHILQMAAHLSKQPEVIKMVKTDNPCVS